MGFRFSWKRPSQPKEHLWCSVIVPAAGSASRMEGTDKILAELGGMPVIARTLLALQRCPYVDEIIVVTREDLMAEIAALAGEYQCTKVSRVVRGGATRAASVRIGLGRVSPKARLIGVHDGARPLVSAEVLEAVFTQAAASGAAAPAVPVQDTVKRVREGEAVTETIPRADLRAVQTPQVFDADLFKAAMQRAAEKEDELTDDCSAIEALGMGVVLTRGSYENLKITTPVDLILGEAILQCQPD